MIQILFKRVYFLCIFSFISVASMHASTQKNNSNSVLDDSLYVKSIALDLRNGIADLADTSCNIDKTLIKVEKSVNAIEDDTDEIVGISRNIADKVCQSESEIDDLSDLSLSILDKICDIQIVVNDTLEKSCDTNSRVEVIESKIDVITGMELGELQDSINDILEKACDTNSRVEVIESKVDLIGDVDLDELQESINDALEKVCAIQSSVEIVESKVDANAESFCQKVEPIQGSISDSFEKTCDIQESVGDIFDKVCSSDSKVDVVESKIDEISGAICAPTPFFSAGTINVSGTYCLANDITGSVVIDANNVTLDLNGHTISGGASNNIEILSGRVNVTIFNGVVGAGQAGAEGIEVNSGARNIKVTEVDFTGGSSEAINATSASVLVNGCSFRNYTGAQVIHFDSMSISQVSDCAFSENSTSSRIIFVEDSSCVTVKDVIICNNTGDSSLIGISADGVNNSNFLNCVITDNDSAGAFTGIDFVSTDTCTIKNCELTGNISGGGLMNGIFVSFGTTLLIDSCLIMRNDSSGLSNVGIRMASINNACLINNVVKFNTGINATIGILHDGTNNGIFNNKVRGHATDYMSLPGDAPIAVYDISAGTFTPTPSPLTSFHNLSIVP